MIEVTDLHGKAFYLNADLIESICANPDTQVVMVTGRHIYVQESARVIADRVVAYRRQCGGTWAPAHRHGVPDIVPAEKPMEPGSQP